jgi:SAM-dependent methyltransferase
MQIDFNRTADDYSRHRAGLPGSFFDHLLQRGIGIPRQRVLDIGTGTATLARGLAKRGASVVGLDIATELMRAARRLEGGDQVMFVRSRAERTPFLDQSFDAVTATQCWHWFDRPAALVEVRRLLRPRGFFVIGSFDWIPVGDNVVALTEEIIERINPQQPKPHIRFAEGSGIYPRWLRDMQDGGFTDIESHSYDVDLSYTHEGWRGRIRASQGVGASLPPEGIKRVDSELTELLKTRFPSEPLAIPHRVFIAISRAP